jgi:murein L,D-transpeptidase YcbB/YkuD
MFVQDLAATLHIMLPSGVQGGNSLKCTSAAARLTYKIVAAAALFGLAAPASAQMPPAPFPPMAFSPLAAGLPNSGAVANFYQRRGNPLIWFASGPRSPAATELLNLLQVARIDGLTNNSRLAMNVQLAIRLAQTGHPTALLEADRTLSTAWVSYVQALRRPPRGTIYGSDAVLPTTGVDRILSEAIGARSMPQHIRAVSTVNPLYGELRQLAVQQYRQWGVIEPRLEANLERTRALPSSGRFVLVDINSARLFMFENGRVADSMKVIVGKAEKQTPMMASMIHYATFNPYWNVPDDMVRDRIAVNVLSQGTKYLHERGYEVVLNWSEHAPVLSPDSIDWRAIADGRTTVRVRQKPGPANSMGNLKFSFPNEQGIYLHDTPDKTLFTADQRALSAGCVRLEDAERLAAWLLRREPWAPSRSPEAHVQLPEGVPIFLTYLTAQARGGELTFTDDVYGLDGTRDAA